MRQEIMAEMKLPYAVKLLEFAQDRLDEMATLSCALETKSGIKRTFQTLPKHLRRRAMSYNSKRVPRRLREIHKHELESQGRKQPAKRPSRRYRRRPSNLLSEYTRRKQKNVWLETHIWHAKRFKVVSEWGYKIPLCPTAKGQRAAYRSIAKNVLVQDISYYNCIEVQGKQDLLLDKLSRLTNKNCGPSFRSENALEGDREGTTFLYSVNKYPYNALGPVSFLWEPVVTLHQLDLKPKSDSERRLWIWHHPSMHDDLIAELTALFEVQIVSGSTQRNFGVETERNGICNTEVVGKSYKARNGGGEIVEIPNEIQVEPNLDKKVKLGTDSKTTGELPDVPGKVQCKTNDGISGIPSKKINDQISDVAKGKSNDVSKTRKRKCSDKTECDNSKSSKKKKTSKVAEKGTGSSAKSSPNVNLSHLMLPPTERVTVYMGTGVTVIDLKDTLVRFRTYGPQSTQVLKKIILPSNVEKTPPWWQKNNKSESDTSESFKLLKTLQTNTWNDLTSRDALGQLPPRFVLGMIARDPRLFMPKKRSVQIDVGDRVNIDLSSGSFVDFSSPKLAYSSLWNSAIRDEVTLTRPSDSHLNSLRSQHLVPGTALDLGDDEPQIPLILVQNPGNRGVKNSCPLGFGAGWDLILPAAWAMPFWVSLSYNGALPAGMQTARFINDSQGLPSFPMDFPDTPAGERWLEKESKELKARELKRPPAKRVNYEALKIVASYSFPWKQLVNDFETVHSSDDPIGEFIVLRDRKELKNLGRIFNQDWKKSVAIPLQIPTMTSRALVCVQVEFIGKGKVDRFGMICIPEKQDMDALEKKQLDYSIDETKPEKREVKTDKKQTVKKREKRKKLRAKIRNLRMGDEVQSEVLETKINRLEAEVESLQGAAEENFEYKCNTVVDSCARRVIGFVTSAQFSLSVGAVGGVGYCVLPGLQYLQKTVKKPVVLVRKKSSAHYTFARLKVSF